MTGHNSTMKDVILEVGDVVFDKGCLRVVLTQLEMPPAVLINSDGEKVIEAQPTVLGYDVINTSTGVEEMRTVRLSDAVGFVINSAAAMDAVARYHRQMTAGDKIVRIH